MTLYTQSLRCNRPDLTIVIIIVLHIIQTKMFENYNKKNIYHIYIYYN